MNILQRINQTDKSQFIYHANRETAQKLGFRYMPFEPDGPAGTVDAILNACELNGDITVYVDENGILAPDGPDWTKTASELLGGKAAAFTADVGSERERWNINGLCASQGIFKPIQDGDEDGPLLNFLADWRAAIEAQLKIRNDRLTVQRALNAVWPKWQEAVAKIDDYYRFAGRYGALIRQTYLDGAGPWRPADSRSRAAGDGAGPDSRSRAESELTAAPLGRLEQPELRSSGTPKRQARQRRAITRSSERQLKKPVRQGPKKTDD